MTYPMPDALRVEAAYRQERASEQFRQLQPTTVSVDRPSKTQGAAHHRWSWRERRHSAEAR
jgi:hypothetical protein